MKSQVLFKGFPKNEAEWKDSLITMSSTGGLLLMEGLRLCLGSAGTVGEQAALNSRDKKAASPSTA